MRKILFFSLLVLFQQSVFAQGNSGLVAHWNFNGNANDVSGNNLNGTIVGAVPSDGYNGLPNTAYSFSGHNGIYVPFNNLMNVDSFSVCVLVKPIGFNSGDCYVNYIMGRDVESTNDHFSMFYSCYSYDSSCANFLPNEEFFCVNPHGVGNNNVVFPIAVWNTVTISSGSWYCVVYTYSRDTIKLYIDGQLRTSTYVHDSYAPSTLGINIGSDADTVNSPFWLNGAIDDIRLYNRALSASEVAQYCDTAESLPTAVNELSTEQEINIYPNPANNTVNVYLPANINKGQITLMNYLGEVVSKNELSNKSSISIDISQLPAGIYFVKAEYNSKVEVKKLIKN